MNRLKGLLRPQVPPRVSSPEGTTCAWILALRGQNLELLRLAVEQLACQKLSCRAARLDWIPVSEPPANTPTTLEGEATSIDLADGRARLHVVVAADREDWKDSDFSWIDLLDQRLRELLAIRDVNAELTAAKRNEHLQKALYAIADLSYSDIDVAELLARVHQIVGELAYTKSFFVALYDDVRDVLRFPYYVDNDDSEEADPKMELAASDYPGSLTFEVLHSGQSLLGPSIELRKRLGLKPHPNLGPECVDWLGVPMLEGDRVRGAVVVQSYDESRRYSEDDRTLLSFVAQQTLSAVTRRQAQANLEAEVLRRTAQLGDANQALREEVAERQHAQQLQIALFRIAELASERGSLKDFYAGIHQVVGKLLNARNFFISTVSDAGDELSFPYFVDERDLPQRTRRVTNGVTEWVLHNKRSLLATETEIQALIEAGEMVIFGTLPKCWLGVPLVFDEHVVGVMVVQSYDAEDDYGLPEQDLLQFASLNIATALERKQTQERLRLAHSKLEQRVEERTEALVKLNQDLRQQIAVREQAEFQLKHEAFHDSLTGLPNRAALLDRLKIVLARYQQDPHRLFAMLFIDLDRFKVVNDSVGHLLGDELLIEAGRRISSCVRSPDAVARLGGDEFTILLEDISEAEEACRVARRVLDALLDPIRLDDKEIYTSASIGIALGQGHYQLPEELLRDADVAMYRAKANGRQRFELFDEQLRQQALDLLELESDIRRALMRNEFEPYLQPIVRLADGAVLGYEALLRWKHASRGMLLPASFLGIAEDSGNVEQIDWQIYEQVCKTIPTLTDRTAYVSINVSARHFRSPSLTANLLELLESCKVSPSRVRIEITEGALLQDPDQASATMLSLREAGVLTALDDFGTGYSSLSYLHRFPLHSLKIDRSFISDLRADLVGNSAAVIRAIVALASSLGMEVIAEGIETSIQHDALRRLDCSIGQGFHFAVPRPAIELTVSR